MADWEAQIHARWAADSTLNGLLDSAKFVTGTYFKEDTDGTGGPTFPYATVTFPGGGVRSYTTDDTVAYPTARISVYHDRDSYDECKAIMDAVVGCFDRAGFTLTGDNDVLNMQLAGEPEYVQDEDGDWYAIADFTVMTRMGA